MDHHIKYYSLEKRALVLSHHQLKSSFIFIEHHKNVVLKLIGPYI